MKIFTSFILFGIIGTCFGAGGAVSGQGGSGGSLTETEETRLLAEGRPLMLTCDYNTTNTDTVWIKDGDEVVESNRIKLFKNSTLYIPAATKQDLGEYHCSLPDEQEPKVFNVVELILHKLLPKSTTVLENDKLSLTCLVQGDPLPTVQWLKNGEPIEKSINSSRLVLSENEYHVPNASLLIKPLMKNDDGDYICLITQFAIQHNTTTDVRVKDIYAALWPFLGIVAEVVLLCTIIFIYERRRIKPNFDESDSEQTNEQKSKVENSKEVDVRQRK
ncbi:basigin-like isoform X1 [Homarus americanus]|uniref:basigin-like isoform X1 n=2 Tax=Homarus americanus TaxID=6706 RepID=UPI001C4763A5|nr:basigin-like isoform X1 [Homarus americanus]